MSAQILEIQPKELKFISELKKQSSCSIRLTNNTDSHVAFKVKTTSPKKYCVRPNVGVILPKSICDFTVTMQAPRTAPIDFECKDKFLIQSTIVSASTSDEDITGSMFVKSGDKYVEEKKLRVILMSPPQSPMLYPITGSLKKGLGHEASVLKDQTLNGAEIFSRQHTIIKDVGESKMVSIEETQPKEDLDLKPARDSELKQMKDVELKPVEDVELNPVEAVESETKPVKDIEMGPARDAELKPAEYVVLKPAEDIELKPKEDVELKPAKDVESLKLVKDIEEMKSKLSEVELKLSKAEVIISKLTVERTSSIEERKILQETLIELSKRGVKRVQVGFPLLYVCMVALISVALGYRLHP
ncbi:vesicle-associated protein 2-2 [Ziziphus jujuba]|uniref:Vesicle-associated protein 2-2 n=1 Tax=Ziziphus jujuba TaxID=326968 RepID=A0A6P3ZNT3_ZIZJJ|nr:vesicle-associated protein 2-2 [Ziziphus jujuba]XP_015875290.2 vesicle-associated protein 2-2 [Ziziphus jujuba]XP_048324553.1 vesicle-associated protein 2-2 [Ziziphus jujuba]XP_060667842.1 vesicle-associated protein 2-2 [Ziziphus jujuba]